MTNADRIEELRKLGKLTILTKDGKTCITLKVGNYTRRDTSAYGIAEAIETFYKRVDLNKHLIEALNCE